MIHFVFRLARRILPGGVKNLLRPLDHIAWKLPPPLSDFRMKGPGVFGTYVERPYEPASSGLWITSSGQDGQ